MTTIYEHDEFYECFKNGLVAYAINTISWLKNYFTNIQIMQLHKSTVFVMLMGVKMPTIVKLN